MAEAIFVGLYSTVDNCLRCRRVPNANSKIAALSQDLYIGGPSTDAPSPLLISAAVSTLVTAVERHAPPVAITAEIRQYSINLIDLYPNFAEVPVLSSICVNSWANETSSLPMRLASMCHSQG